MNVNNDTDADDCGGSNVTKIYMAGSIDHSDDDGRGWRTTLQEDAKYERANVEFLNPLDFHDPRERDFERSDIVSDDLSLLDAADGILLRYEHGQNCWGTPSEQGYALAVNRHTDRHLPVAVWWSELDEQATTKRVVLYEDDWSFKYSIEDASPWLHDPQCTIGVYENQTTALTSLLSSTGHGNHSPYPNEVSTEQQSSQDDVSAADTTILYEGTPLVEVLEMFAEHGLGNSVPREWFNETLIEYDSKDIASVLSFLETLGVVEERQGYTVEMEDDSRSRELLETFVDKDDRVTTTMLAAND